MSRRKSVFQVLVIFILAVSLVTPQANLSAEIATPEQTDVVVPTNEDQQEAAPSNEGTVGEDPEDQTPDVKGTDGDGESPDGQAPEGDGSDGDSPDGESTEGEGSEGQTPEDEGSEAENSEDEAPGDDGSEGVSSEGEIKPDDPAQEPDVVSTNSDGGFSTLQQTVDYCDPSTRPAETSISEWLATAPDGAETDCIDLTLEVENCSISADLNSRVSGYSYDLTWVEGEDISDSSTWNTTFPVSFEPGYNGGSVVVTVFVVGSEEAEAYVLAGGTDVAEYAYSSGGVSFNLQTNCNLPIPDPGLPSPIPVEACQVSYAGHTRMTDDGGVDERIKIPNQNDGEINGDGWGTTMRLYAATRDDLTNVTLTYQTMGGGNFGTEINTLQSPGGGALQGDGYTVAASGYDVVVNGDTITVTVASMPANSSLSFNIPVMFAEGQPTMYVHSWMTGTETNCDTEIPPMPEIPAAEVCQQVLAGRTITSGPNANVAERPKFGEGGEVNADGWGSTFRLYGATDVPLTNVVATFTNTHGFSFEGTFNALENPGVGNLPNTGYTEPVDGISVSVTARTVTVTIESMPANSSWSVNAPIVIEAETGKVYMDSLMISDLVDCEPAVLELPDVSPSVCNDEGQAVPPVVEAPEDSDSVSYGTLTTETGDDGVTFSITATANNGFTFEGATMPEGWTLVNFGQASYSVTLPLADCELPLEVVTPEVPTLVAAVCTDSNEPVDPTLTVPDNTDGITYGEVTVSPANSVMLSVTATANAGYTFIGAEMPEGWTMVSATEAVYETLAETIDCETPPVDPVDPPTVVTPDLPTVVAAVCNDDNDAVPPTLTVPETEGITYGEVTSSPANSVMLSLTATANDGYTFTGATMPEGWTMVSPTEALYEIVADEVTCPAPDEKPEEEKTSKVTELPSTGTGTTQAPMIGLAATAAAAIAGAGIFFTNRKR